MSDTMMEHYDDLTLQTGEIVALAGLLEQIGNLGDDANVQERPILEGVGAIARVIVEKVQAIDKHAEALKGAAE